MKGNKMKVYRLTRQEIGDAITNYIGTFIEKQGFFPFRISDTDERIKLPNTVTFQLELIPEGSKRSKETEHAI